MGNHEQTKAIVDENQHWRQELQKNCQGSPTAETACVLYPSETKPYRCVKKGVADFRLLSYVTAVTIGATNEAGCSAANFLVLHGARVVGACPQGGRL